MAALGTYQCTSSAPSSVVSHLTMGNIANVSLNSLAYNAGLLGVTSSATTAAAAISGLKCYGFTLTPESGYDIDFTSLTLKACGYDASTPRGMVVRSSVDSYAADLYNAAIVNTYSNLDSVNIDLSGASFQGITSAITFRVYVYAPTTSLYVLFDNITPNGTVSAVPAGGFAYSQCVMIA